MLDRIGGFQVSRDEVIRRCRVVIEKKLAANGFTGVPCFHCELEEDGVRIVPDDRETARWFVISGIATATDSEFLKLLRKEPWE